MGRNLIFLLQMVLHCASKGRALLLPLNDISVRNGVGGHILSCREGGAFVTPASSCRTPSTLFASRIALLQSNRHASTTTTALNARARRRRKRRRRGRARHGVDVAEFEDCMVLDRGDIDHQGLAKSIDAEYAAEEEKLGLSFWQVLER